jgi:glycosyltransferase involved in cell wall biosynthesis
MTSGQKRLRLVLHDYPGHAFPIQLSRALARRGHEVLHLYFDQFQSPRGPVAPLPDDPATLTIVGVRLDRPFQKYNLIHRAWMERLYAGKLVARVAEFRPDVVFGGNGPLDPQAALQRWSRRHGVGFVFWLQDFYGVAIDGILRRKLGAVGALVGWYYRRLEQRLWRRSDEIVLITEDFRPLVEAAGVAAKRLHVIENWAPLDGLPLRDRYNDWAVANNLARTRNLLYSGTLGLKHNPALLVALAQEFRDVEDVRIVVVTEGIGHDYLAREKEKLGLDNLILLGFQPYEALPDLIASGDVLVVLLETDAGIYSVPSKVLTYCCAARAILGAIPPENLAARLILREQAGLVASPDDAAGFAAAARRLMASAAERAKLAAGGRAYAERSFDIETIADRFEAVLLQARDRGHRG